MKTLLAAAALLIAALAQAQAPASAPDKPSSQAERERIAKQRQVAEAQYAQREAECKRRFVVTSCIDQARADRRQSLDNLHQQEIALDEVERQQRSAEHRRRREAKAWEEINKPAPEPRLPREPKAREPKPLLPPSGGASRPAPVDRSADEQQARERFEARQREAQAHKAEIEERNRKKAAARKPALPMPAASSP
jgi:colicin import membrane protein